MTWSISGNGASGLARVQASILEQVLKKIGLARPRQSTNGRKEQVLYRGLPELSKNTDSAEHATPTQAPMEVEGRESQAGHSRGGTQGFGPQGEHAHYRRPWTGPGPGLWRCLTGAETVTSSNRPWGYTVESPCPSCHWRCKVILLQEPRCGSGEAATLRKPMGGGAVFRLHAGKDRMPADSGRTASPIVGSSNTSLATCCPLFNGGANPSRC